MTEIGNKNVIQGLQKKGGKKRIVIKERFCLLLAGQPPVTTLRIVSLSELTIPSRGTAFPPFNTSTVS